MAGSLPAEPGSSSGLRCPRVQADVPHGPAKLYTRRCAICLSWRSRPLRGLTAGRSTRGPPWAQARRSD